MFKKKKKCQHALGQLLHPDFITNSSTGLTNSANSSSILALPRQKKSLVIATAVMSKMKPPLYMVSTQTQTKGGTAALCQGSACSMSRHRVSQLIVISSLIRPGHLLGLCLTLEGKSDTEGCGRQLGGGERKRDAHHTSPLQKHLHY